MFQNNIKIALRALRKNVSLTGLNIFGLAIGIATALIIMLYVQKELSHDGFHEKADRIVRVVMHGNMQGEALDEPMVMPPVAQTLQAAFPEIEATTRLRQRGNQLVSYNGQTFQNQRIASVDSSFFSVFSFPLIAGNTNTVLTQPNTIVISEKAAKQYFNHENPVGKIIRLKNWNADYKVTGIMADMPDNSHIQFDLLASMSSFEDARIDSWMTSEFYTYLVLPKDYNTQTLEAKLPAVFAKNVNPQLQKAMGMTLAEMETKGSSLGLFLQPLTDIHLHSNFAFDLAPHGDIRYVYIFIAIALFILLIAIINFINLATAGASKRAGEVGVRKVLGSNRRELIQQFLTESILMAMFSLAIGLLLLKMVLPFFNQLTDNTLELTLFSHPLVIPVLLMGGLLIGAAAGAYPAFFLANFKPKDVLKGSVSSSQKSAHLRSGLVVFQFVLTITLLIATTVVYQQMQFIQNTKLGFNPKSVLVVSDLWKLNQHQNAFKQQLENDPRVLSCSYSGYLPVGESFYNNFFLSNADRTISEVKTLRYDVDENYLKTLDIGLASGRNFAKERSSDSTSIIINEAAAKAMNWDAQSAVNQTLLHADNQGIKTNYKVIGVVEDFHFKPLHERISPLVMTFSPSNGSAIIKLKTTDYSTLLADLKTRWQGFTTDHAFHATFLDDRHYATYATERTSGILLSIFAGLTIFVACLGLFGLTIFMIERRTKEIGIRKVLGASVTGIVQLLSKDFLKLVLIAFVIACPLAWYISNQWLQDFAYRVELSWQYFLLGGIMAMLIAFLTVSMRSVRAALMNPSQVLSDE